MLPSWSMAETVPSTGRGGQGWSGRSTGQVGPAVTRPRTPVPSSDGGGVGVAGVPVVPGSVVVGTDANVLPGSALPLTLLRESALPDAELEENAVVDRFAAIGVEDEGPQAVVSTAKEMVAASGPIRRMQVGRIDGPYGFPRRESSAPRLSIRLRPRISAGGRRRTRPVRRCLRPRWG